MKSWRIGPKLLLLALVAVIAPGSLQFPPVLPVPPPLPWPELSPIVASDPVGYLPAASSVGPSGEYRVSIPFDVPPGRAGMAPSVGLTYGSHGGDDIAGIGWTLAATSLIQRCDSSVAVDGFTDGVDFTDDRFCLDGARLVAVAGAYGAVATEYRTERDPFSKIVSFGDAGDGPAGFKVYLPDGRISTYDGVAATRVPDSMDVRDSVTLAYVLSETADRNGNSVRYHYATDQEPEEPWGLSLLLSDVEYTNSALEEGRREVIFTYDDRPDPAFAYTAGVRTRRDKRLARVDMKAPNPGSIETVWSYVLTYDQSPDSGRSRLHSVRKLDAAGVSLWAKEIDWAEHAPATFDFEVLPDLLAEPTHDPWGWDHADVVPADLDGDGKDELLVHFSENYPGKLWRTDDPAFPLSSYSDLDESSYYFNNGRPLDRQNDGRAELLVRQVFQDGSVFYKTVQWDAAAQDFTVDQGLGAPIAREPVVVDIDGNGWADTLYVPTPWQELSNWNLVLGGVGGFGPPADIGIVANVINPERVLDIDGDGRGDVVIDDPAFVPPPDLRPPGFVPQHTMVLRRDDAGQVVGDTRWDLGNQRPITLADVNGDGLKDAVDLRWLGGIIQGTRVRFNEGNGFGSPVDLPGSISKGIDDHAGVRVADFDRDGRDDLLVFRENQYEPRMAVYLSRPSGFQEVPFDGELISGLGFGDWNLLKVGDFNGDGLPDVAYLQQLPQPPYNFPYDWNVHLVVATQRSGESDVIVALRDEGAGEPQETVSYTRKLDRVEGDASCDYPQRCVPRGTLLVDEVKTYRPDSAVPQRRLKYHFAGGKSDMMGRGFLGFSQVIEDDEDSRARTITTYDNTTRDGTIYPFAGLPASTMTITPILAQGGSDGEYLTAPNGQATARVHRVDTAYEMSRQYANQAYFVRPTHSVETEWEQACDVSGDTVVLLDPTPKAARKVVRDFGYDDYGNMVFEEHQTTKGVHGLTVRAFDNRTVDDWLLRLEVQRNVSEAEFGQPLPAARVTAMTYDERGRLSTVVREPFDPSYTATTSFEYTEDGLLAQVTRSAAGLASRHSSLFYDAEGIYAYAVRDELGHVSRTLHHPALGVAVVTAGPDGVQARASYDGFGRLRRVESDSGAVTDFGLEPWMNGDDEVLGIVTRASSLDGAEAYEDVDALGRVREAGTLGFDGQWIITAANYTAYGAPFFRTRPGEGAPGWPTITQFDTLGRPQWVHPPDGADVTFAYEMFASTSADPKGRAHRTEVDKDGRPIRTVEYADDGHEIVTTYERGDFGQLARIVDAAGHATQFDYDGIGRQRTLTDPDRGVVTFTYDGFDEVVEEQDAIHDIAYLYDALGRMLEKDDTHGSPSVTEKTSFEFDGGEKVSIGKLVKATSPDGVVTDFTYDSLGRPSKTTWTIDGESFAVEQTYDSHVGRPERRYYPEVPGRARFYTDVGYNQFGYANTVSTEPAPALPLWRVVARSPEGRLEQARWMGNRVETRSYDSNTGRLDTVRVDLDEPYAAPPLFEVLYEYQQGELSKRTDTVAHRTETFAYDALDRLTGYTLRTNTPREVTYAYDDLGNLTTVATRIDGQLQPVETLGYDTNNRPHAARTRTAGAAPPVTYWYDARGRMIESDGRGVTYTGFDLPRTITQGQTRTTFEYDAFGTRVKKTVAPIGEPESPTSTTVTLAGLYERRTHKEETQHRFYVQGEGGPVSEVVYDEDSGKEDLHHIVRDGHGSVGLVIDPDGTTVERLYYEPFGGRVDEKGSPVSGTASGMRWGFTGHEEDDDLGLINMKGRVYDPVLRRFWTPDPIVHNPLVGQTFNAYSYVWNNPLRYVDPSGLDGEGDEAASSGWTWQDVADFFTSFLGNEETLQKNKPEGQLLPNSSTTKAGDAQADEGSSSSAAPAPSAPTTVPKTTHAPMRAVKPVTSSRIEPGIAGVCPAVALGSAAINTADTAKEHVKKVVAAIAKGDPYHAADEALAIPEDAGRQAGGTFLEGVHGVLSMPDDIHDLGHADTLPDKINAAADVIGDGLAIGGAVLLVAGIGEDGLRAASSKNAALLRAQLRMQEGLAASGRIAMRDALELGTTRAALFDVSSGTLHVGAAGDRGHYSVMEKAGLPLENGRYVGGFLVITNEGKLIFRDLSGTFPSGASELPGNVLDLVRGTGVSIQ